MSTNTINKIPVYMFQNRDAFWNQLIKIVLGYNPGRIDTKKQKSLLMVLCYASISHLLMVFEEIVYVFNRISMAFGLIAWVLFTHTWRGIAGGSFFFATEPTKDIGTTAFTCLKWRIVFLRFQYFHILFFLFQTGI